MHLAQSEIQFYWQEDVHEQNSCNKQRIESTRAQCS